MEIRWKLTDDMLNFRKMHSGRLAGRIRGTFVSSVHLEQALSPQRRMTRPIYDKLTVDVDVPVLESWAGRRSVHLLRTSRDARSCARQAQLESRPVSSS